MSLAYINHHLQRVFNNRDLSLLAKVEPLYCIHHKNVVTEIFLENLMCLHRLENELNDEYH